MTTILAFETSCDDTAAAIVRADGSVLAEALFSQTKEHENYGGVVPEVGSRAHIEQILSITKNVVSTSSVKLEDVDAIAATFAPGLIGPLLVGAQFAKGLALALNKPLVGIHHIEGHIFSGYGDKNFPTPPFVALIVSGGHTALYDCDETYSISLLGQTLDDAAGEAFDKIGRALGLGYPAGKIIDEIAGKSESNHFSLPIAMRREEHFNFSFSGLKTKALEIIARKTPFVEGELSLFCSSVREAIAVALCERSIKAVESKGYRSLVLGGGVAANSRVRELFVERCQERGIEVYLPKVAYCTDNAVMIAKAAHIRYQQGRRTDASVDVLPTLPIERAHEMSRISK